MKVNVKKKKCCQRFRPSQGHGENCFTGVIPTLISYIYIYIFFFFLEKWPSQRFISLSLSLFFNPVLLLLSIFINRETHQMLIAIKGHHRMEPVPLDLCTGGVLSRKVELKALSVVEMSCFILSRGSCFNF